MMDQLINKYDISKILVVPVQEPAENIKKADSVFSKKNIMIAQLAGLSGLICGGFSMFDKKNQASHKSQKSISDISLAKTSSRSSYN